MQAARLAATVLGVTDKAVVQPRTQLKPANISPNSNSFVTSRLDTFDVHFGCVELVEEHGPTRSSRRARHVERVET